MCCESLFAFSIPEVLSSHQYATTSKDWIYGNDQRVQTVRIQAKLRWPAVVKASHQGDCEVLFLKDLEKQSRLAYFCAAFRMKGKDQTRFFYFCKIFIFFIKCFEIRNLNTRIIFKLCFWEKKVMLLKTDIQFILPQKQPIILGYNFN